MVEATSLDAVPADQGHPSHGADRSSFSVALIVATRSRPHDIEVRLPVWTNAGFDEVLIVDGSYNPETRQRIRGACERSGATYVGAPRTTRDIRSLQRNLGARTARSTWILFQDDDDDAVVRINKHALAEAVVGRDWITGPVGEHIVWHRRQAFLAFGGYPEDMVAAEDGIMSNRARRFGVGGMEPKWYDTTKRFPPAKTDPISRIRNAFWYGYTVLLLVCRTSSRRDVVLGDIRRMYYQFRRGWREPWRFLVVMIGLWARIASPIHVLLAVSRSGLSALRQEPNAGWGGIRP